MKEENGPAPAAAVSFLLLLFVLKLLLAWRFPGYLSGDDLEVLQTAARYAWGLDYQPWSLRCLFHPLVFIWPVLELADLAGARDPTLLSWLGTLPAAAASTFSILLVYRLAKALDFSEPAARVAAFFSAFHWLSLGYGATHFPRPISTAFLLGAFLVTSRPVRGWSGAVAGALAAAAFAVRWSEGVVLAPLLGFAWWKHRDRRLLLSIAGGFAAGAVLFVGLTDTLTWGAPFASLREFFRVMLPDTRPPAPRADQPFFWFYETALRWAGPLFLLLLLPAWRDRRSRALFAILAANVLLLSFFQFKAWRFLVSSVPFLSLAAALGWDRLRQGSRPAHGLLAVTALLLSVPLGLERTWTLLSDKSQPAIAAARYMAELQPPPRIIVLEQAWAYGERIFLGNGPRIRDVAPARPLDPAVLREAALDGDAVAIYRKDSSPALERVLTDLGFREAARFRGDTFKEVVVYLPAR